jgi:hypothetical protein
VRTRPLVVSFLLLAGFAMPSAHAHNAAVAPEQYVRFLSDCSDDWGGHSAVSDGHDLVALDVTDRWMAEAREPGLFVLLTVAFGFAETGSQGGPLRDEVELRFGASTVKVRLATTDNKVFTAEAGAGYKLPDVILPVRQSLLSNGQPDGSRIQVEFGFRYSSLGIKEGTKLTGVEVHAFAREERGDFMPGGYYVLGVATSEDPRDCPRSGHQGAGDPGTLYIRKDYTLRGSERPYMSLGLDTDAVAVAGSSRANFHVEFKNPFANDDQDVRIELAPPAGWNALVGPPARRVVDPLGTWRAPVTVFAETGRAANGTLEVIVDTDAGGHATRSLALYWYPEGVTPTVPTTEATNAPGSTVVVLVMVLGLLVVLGRRR